MQTSRLNLLRKDLRKLANPQKAKFFPRFFKAGPGGYAEGDKFIGVTVPNSRSIAKKYKDLSLAEIQQLLSSKIHEERLVSILILVENFKKGNEKTKQEIYNFYLKNTKYINNWDLVDLSAEYIVGGYLYDKPKSILYKLAKSKNLWERRIAIISTFEFIRQNRFKETVEISEMLLKDNHDLIHKAVGWMLREMGKRSASDLENFLKKHYKVMPRTMLRYAIERFSQEKRRAYLE